MRSRLIVLAALTSLIAACGGGGGERTRSSGSSAEAEVPGSEAAAADADRQIEVGGKDSLEFDPAEIEVKAGETVTFIITNEGKAEHEFILGNEAYQVEHEAEMAEGGGEHGGGHGSSRGDPNIVSVAAGDTEEVTWTFTEPGEVLYGCHEPGHYEGGMVGTITVV